MRTPLVDKQIPEQAKALGISEDRVIKELMLGETVDGQFTLVDDARCFQIECFDGGKHHRQRT